MSNSTYRARRPAARHVMRPLTTQQSTVSVGGAYVVAGRRRAEMHRRRGALIVIGVSLALAAAAVAQVATLIFG